ncbi:MAG TPA: hypothetical protein VHB50_14845 [Bryobacteraceae bacterium]|nr:hypothetical protein [Bryobacteraceae bacterium]
MNWAGLLAQCVMCYRTAAAQQAERARVLNTGILILLIPPVVIIGFILFRALHSRRSAQMQADKNN